MSHVTNKLKHTSHQTGDKCNVEAVPVGYKKDTDSTILAISFQPFQPVTIPGATIRSFGNHNYTQIKPEAQVYWKPRGHHGSSVDAHLTRLLGQEN